MTDEGFPYRYLAIEGPIAAGKTTLASLLADRFGIASILEELDNPFLPAFYREPRTYGLPTQLYFLVARHRAQLELARLLHSGRSVVTDFSFWRDLVFALVNLVEAEMRVYERMWGVLSKDAVMPDLVVWLDAPEGFLFDRIRRRGREFERPISKDYLKRLRAEYARFFGSWGGCDILKVPSDRYDFEHDASCAERVVRAILEREASLL